MSTTMQAFHSQLVSATENNDAYLAQLRNLAKVERTQLATLTLDWTTW